MNLSSVIVHARPEYLGSVQECLLTLPGVEIHTATEEGRLIVTIEADSDRAVADTYEAINKQPHVLSASMVYHQYEPNPDEEV